MIHKLDLHFTDMCGRNSHPYNYTHAYIIVKGEVSKVFGDTFTCKETTGSLTSSERVKQEMVMYFQIPVMDIDKIH